MTNEQVLKKAIEKAVKGGWQDCNIPNWYWKDIGYIKNNWIGIDNELYFSIIFSHSFAKAFWGEKEHLQLLNHTEDGKTYMGGL